jgi:nucleoside phosphorylase
MSLIALVVEDDKEKAAEVKKGLIAAGFDSVIISGDAVSAKLQLRETFFHLVVLDIALPLRAGGDPTPRGGLDLLKELLERALYKQPRHFIGLTAHQDIFERAASEFGAEQWSAILYDRSSSAWLEQLQIKARHIAASEAADRQNTSFLSDICVITALDEPELQAVLALQWGWKAITSATDATTYYAGETKFSGTQRKIVAARASAMGIAPAAVLATKMLLEFRPRCVVMCGICAGVRSAAGIGDLLVANPSWDYGSGKHLLQDERSVFEPAPDPHGLSTRVRGLAEQLKANSAHLHRLREQFRGQKPNSVLELHIGPVASGAAVLANDKLLNEIKSQQNRKLLGIDMEGYGVMTAAAEVPAPRPEAVIIKAVSDYADSSKNDHFRHYAAYVSAGALRLLVEEYGL